MCLLMRSLMMGWLALSSYVRKARETATYKLLLTDPQGLLLAIFRALEQVGLIIYSSNTLFY